MRRLIDCALLCVAALVLALLCVVFIGFASAQEGHIGHGHEKWHQGFYSALQRPDGKGSCCNLFDCRPTSVRTSNGYYEIMKDGRWVRLPLDKVIRRTAPDGGAHICAPDSKNNRYDKDEVFCAVLPSET
jgi:hypothetical protein